MALVIPRSLPLVDISKAFLKKNSPLKLRQLITTLNYELQLKRADFFVNYVKMVCCGNFFLSAAECTNLLLFGTLTFPRDS